MLVRVKNRIEGVAAVSRQVPQNARRHMLTELPPSHLFTELGLKKVWDTEKAR